MNILLRYDQSQNNKVYKLKKTIYGLKQSPRAWFGKFTKVMKQFGYMQSNRDHTLFFKHSDEGKSTIVLVYVDDIIATGSDLEELRQLIYKLSSQFDMKYLGILNFFLGLEIYYLESSIFLSQQNYTMDLLKET